ncbi:hypothetical protein DFJ77DRAFT_440614 [Powellomyces hirtus]|nr:hypothetical protein DFJ77DRAFT_440614 [Powellomyces hirtus]
MEPCCSSPSPEDTGDRTGTVVCTSCGHLFVAAWESSANLHDEWYPEHRVDRRAEVRSEPGRYVLTKNPDELRSDTFTTHTYVLDVLTALKLYTFRAQVLDMFWATHSGMRVAGNCKRRRIAACTLTVARAQSAVVYVPDLLREFDIDKGELLKGLNEIRKFRSDGPRVTFPSPAPATYELDTYLPRLCEEFTYGGPPSKERSEHLYRDGHLILIFAKRASLEIGRFAGALEGAAFCLSYEAQMRKKAGEPVHREIAGIIGAGRRNLAWRYKELKEMLVKCSEAFPFLGDLSKKAAVFYKTLPELLLALAREHDESDPSSSASAPSLSSLDTLSPSLPTESVTTNKLKRSLVPPAFAHAARKRHKIDQRIQKAKLHIARLHAGQVEDAGEDPDGEGDTDVDDEYGDQDGTDGPGRSETPGRDRLDKRIEQALLDGYTEAHIRSFRHRIYPSSKYDPTVPEEAQPQNSTPTCA